MKLKDKISLVVPCFNEEAALPLFYAETIRVADEMKEQEFEFLFIDDGSTDHTLDILKRLAEEDSRIRYFSFSRNFGKESAMYAGFRHASGDYVAVMDADMQDPPSLLPEMYRIVTEEGFDSVATRRVNRKGEPPIRSLFAKLFYRIINRISDADIVDGARDFWLMSRKMADAIIQMGEYNRFTKGIYGWIGFHTKWLPYHNVERVAGETKWSFWKLFWYSVSGIVNFSDAPLLISSVIGMVCCLIALAAVIVIIVRRLVFGDPVAGWASLACLITFFGGIQLLCIGIIGQYLAKTYTETKKRPIYILKESNWKEKMDDYAQETDI
ncbi:MAG: glycosyltransferase family 2 protein [Clostridiales bacterium]|nr:glycosyltransferase family 2 protein [Clostridiales bacterium]